MSSYYEGSETKGFTLIEFLIMVVTIGIIVAIAIPAYLSYSKKAQLSEVLIGIDSVAQSACEYHAEYDVFPPTEYGVDNLSLFRQQYATLSLENSTPADNVVNIVANFTGLDLTVAAGTKGILKLRLSYDVSTGYIKRWDSVNSSLDDTFMPR